MGVLEKSPLEIAQEAAATMAEKVATSFADFSSRAHGLAVAIRSGSAAEIAIAIHGVVPIAEEAKLLYQKLHRQVLDFLNARK